MCRSRTVVRCAGLGLLFDVQAQDCCSMCRSRTVVRCVGPGLLSDVQVQDEPLVIKLKFEPTVSPFCCWAITISLFVVGP